jgi:Ca-activated chloride channel family protein
MDIAMVTIHVTSIQSLIASFKVKYKRLYQGGLIAIPLLIALFIYLKPQQFIDLWLTRDQQGQVLFDLGYYQKSSAQFTDTQWKAFASYGAEEYKQAASLYSQFNDTDSKVAQANALAHGREYIDARNMYQEILVSSPKNKAAATNILVVQAIIDEVNRLSASQKAEQGEAIKDLGDEPQTGDGAQRKEAPPVEVEQLTAEQLLLDPSLNEMWLRQVQKDPARFLSQKFFMQNKQADKTESLNSSSTKQGVN